MIEPPRAYPRDATTLEHSEPVAAPAVSEPVRMVLVVHNADTARTFELHEGRELTLGRAEHADIMVPDPSLSRLHARFSRQADRVQVTDLESRNGTWLQGKRIDSATLRAGASLALGAVSASLQISPAAQLASLGLASSATLLELIEDECARSRVFGRPLSLLLVRASGARASSTARLAQRCVPKLRALDRAAPYEAETLLILLPETTGALALTLAQGMLAANGGESALLCGIASVPTLDPEPQQLLAAAQSALAACTNAEPCSVAERPRSGARLVAVRAEPPPQNAAMLELQRLIERLATRRISVLVLGETGTGKELVARDLHRLSPRRNGPLKIVNCAAIPEALIESVLFGHVKGAFTGADRDRPGVFAQAHGGTLVLDEVGELSAGAQAALLRVLDTARICPVGGAQELTVDVRVVAATHRDLASMAERGSFRLDLYHRLNSVTLRVPALRERSDELEALIDHFIAHAADATASGEVRPHFSAAALALLRAHDWPGNVRELRNVVERALALRDGELLGVSDLPPELVADCNDMPEELAADGGSAQQMSNTDSSVTANDDLALRASLATHEVELIREALRRCDGNQRRAAYLLQLPLRTLERKLRALGPRARTP